jgi:hypothetical protein
MPVAIPRRAHAVLNYDDVFDDDTIYNSSNAITRIDREFAAAICVYDLDGRVAEINFGQAERQEAIDVKFAGSTTASTMRCDDSAGYID